MKETGIIMSGDHPKLILDGIKTMTRRVIVPQPHWSWDETPYFIEASGQWCFHGHDGWGYKKCPYGQVGDRLWVREKALYWGGGAGGCSDVIYTDDPEIPELLADNDRLANYRDIKNIIEGQPVLGKWVWKPSIHMFRWASRILLEITGLRAERLQEISNEDAKAEGVIPMSCCLPGAYHYITPFKELWDSLNAKRGYGWEVNPWVWPISFKLVSR